jgi:hypothetical protein
MKSDSEEEKARSSSQVSKSRNNLFDEDVDMETHDMNHFKKLISALGGDISYKGTNHFVPIRPNKKFTPNIGAGDKSKFAYNFQFLYLFLLRTNSLFRN